MQMLLGAFQIPVMPRGTFPLFWGCQAYCLQEPHETGASSTLPLTKHRVGLSTLINPALQQQVFRVGSTPLAPLLLSLDYMVP